MSEVKREIVDARRSWKSRFGVGEVKKENLLIASQIFWKRRILFVNECPK